MFKLDLGGITKASCLLKMFCSKRPGIKNAPDILNYFEAAYFQPVNTEHWFIAHTKEGIRKQHFIFIFPVQTQQVFIFINKIIYWIVSNMMLLAIICF